MIPRRVLMTADAVGGVWTYALDLAGGLSAAGVEVALAVLGPSPDAAQARDARAVAGLTLIDTGLPLDWTADDPGQILQAGAAVRDLARRLGADLVHLNSPALAAVGDFPAPVLGACHSCLATWWAAVKEGPMPADFAWRSEALGRGLAACDALVAPSASFAQATADAYGLPPPRVVLNGRRGSGAPRARRRERLVFTSGRLWDEGKNLAVLDAAAARADAPLYAAGPLDGPGASFRPTHLRALGRLPSPGVADWLARAPVYATSARYEPFGLGVLEAAQAGCALVLSDIATFRELWAGAAVFADPRDPAAFAGAFDALLADPARAGRLGAVARERARRFTAEAMSAGMLDLYRELGAARPASGAREAAA